MNARLLIIIILTAAANTLAARQRVVDDIYYNRRDAQKEAWEDRRTEAPTPQWKNGSRRIIFTDDSTGRQHPDTVRCIIRDADDNILISQAPQRRQHTLYAVVADPWYAWPHPAWNIAWSLLDPIIWLMW